MENASQFPKSAWSRHLCWHLGHSSSAFYLFLSMTLHIKGHQCQKVVRDSLQLLAQLQLDADKLMGAHDVTIRWALRHAKVHVLSPWQHPVQLVHWDSQSQHGRGTEHGLHHKANETKPDWHVPFGWKEFNNIECSQMPSQLLPQWMRTVGFCTQASTWHAPWREKDVLMWPSQAQTMFLGLQRGLGRWWAHPLTTNAQS